MPTSSTGLHLVRKRLKSGDRWYVYAHRGGPLILKKDGAKPVITEALLRKAYGQPAPSDTLHTLCQLYLASPDFAEKRPATQREYKHRLYQIADRFGRIPMSAVSLPAFKGEILAWRDEQADTPRAADRVVGMLSTLLSWAMDRGLVESNPALGVKKLHKSNRADLIWELRHWEAIKDIPPHIHRVFQLGALTGLRISDLLALQWEQVTRHYIAVETRKTGGVATIPMHRELEAFLVGPGTGPILRNTRLQQWTPDGFQSSWQRVRPDGFDRKTHDLRGTFATRLMIAGFSDPEVAAMMGWTAERSAAIRLRYVDRDRVAREMAGRFSTAVVNHGRGEGAK